MEQDDDSTRAIYGKSMTFRNILSGKALSPKSADAFMKAVSRRRPTGTHRGSKRRQEIILSQRTSAKGCIWLTGTGFQFRLAALSGGLPFARRKSGTSLEVR